MKDYTTSTPQFSDTISEPETTDLAHPDSFNPAYEQLLQNTLVLNQIMPGLAFDDEEGVVVTGGGSGGGGGGGSYVLPTATASRLGGVKIGDGIDVATDGTISANVDTSAEKAAEIAESEISDSSNDFTDEDVQDIFK